MSSAGSAGALDPESKEAIAALRKQYPHTPFLTLGQTVFWDEPVKAAFVQLLRAVEAENPSLAGGRMVAGVHDTDYFAKLAGLAVRDTPFVLLRHNDGDTRGLWSAAGEISALFGAEVVPSHADFTRNGVAFAKAVRAYPGGTEALLNQETEAPLWRAIVHTEPHTLLASDVRLGDIAPALVQQIRWAFRQSLRAIGCPEDFESEVPCESRAVARQVMGWVENYLIEHPERTLSDLYRYLIPQMWALTGGANVVPDEVTASVELFRFNGETAQLPRFQFVDVFLNPATRALARRCYDEAVAGSGIYTLDQFGPGALPFDVVIPGQGRGTLRLHESSLYIETEEPIELCDGCDPDSVAALAGILHRKFGPNVMLVGKAVALISMLASEYIFVFHEKASAYTARTGQMNQSLRDAGVKLNLHPMLRVKHATWDAAEGLDGRFYPPEHLREAFGEESVTPTEFAARWHGVGEAQESLRDELKAATKPRDLMRLLARHGGGVWLEKEQAYVAARGVLNQVQEGAAPMREEIAKLKEQVAHLVTEARDLENAKGEHYRATVAPLRDEIAALLQAAQDRLSPVDAEGNPRKLNKEERAQMASLQREEDAKVVQLRSRIAELEIERVGFDERLAAVRKEASALRAEVRHSVRRMLEWERGKAAGEARAALNRLEAEAELERLRLVRNTILVSDSLTYTNYRPTAWWLPMVSPDGSWFRRLVQLAKVRVEAL